MRVIKRNGDLEDFNIKKIVTAIEKAYNANDMNLSSREKKIISKKVTKHFLFANWINRTIPIETIQDYVEKFLLDNAPYKVARSYIVYRETHKFSRFVKDRINYMIGYTNSDDNAATASEVDANANVTVKNVANLEGEVYKSFNKIIQRQRMKDKLNELYPEVADQYAQDLKNGIIYCHDESSSPALKFYCLAATLYPLMLEGTGNIDNVTPTPPNDIQSFSGQVTNLVFLLSSQAKGAVALGDYFIALNLYVIKEFGENWYEKLDKVTTTKAHIKQRTIKDAIRKGMKQFIYGVNQPAGNRSYNSPFTNVSFYDRYYFESLFKEFYYPDGTQPKWEAIDQLQRIFMELHRELRLVKPLTFPVTTMALLHDGKDFKDQEYKNLCAEEWAKGGSFFLYTNDNASSLASCCFSEDTKFLWKSSTYGVNCTTFKEFVELPYKGVKENFKIYHNGSWIGGKVVALNNRSMYKVITENNNEYLISDNHINVTFDGEKRTKDLALNDYLMFNTKLLNAVKENDEHLTYEQGLLIGLFIGDGTFGSYVCENGCVNNFQLSLNEEKYNKVKSYLEQYGEYKLRINENNCYNVFYHDRNLVAFIEKWTGCIPLETYSYNKNINLNCLLQSPDFRKGILDGWYITDGGNSNRCYTTSKELAFNMQIVINSLGLQSVCNISDRTDETVAIRDNEYKRNFPLYCVRYYDNSNCRTRPESGFKWKNNSVYWKIKSIEKIQYNGSIYCIECANQEEPYFTLPTGLITHNCRVLNEVSDNTFSSTTGMTGIMTGSCNVITLNINRIVQDYYKVNAGCFDMLKLKEYLITILERVYKYQIAYKTMLYDMEDKGMYSSSNAGYIYLKKLYSTIGLIGYYEAAKFLGYTVEHSKGDVTDYVNFLGEILGTVKEQNKLHSIHDKKRPHLFNSEAVPGENLGVKFYEKDKADGYWVPEDQNLYNCYFYNPWGEEIIFDKMRLHGRNVSTFCDGGQAAHLNLQEHLTKEQYLTIMQFAIREGVNYFTFNIPFSECKDCHHVVHAPIKECPKCHSTNIDWWTRIIGYLRPISAFSRPRQIEADKRYYNTDGKYIVSPPKLAKDL